jgi:heptosyltransferase-2
MEIPDRVLIIQTAFLGDVILTIPLARAVHRELPGSTIDLVTIPSAAGIIESHPDIRRVIIFDKRQKDSGVSGFLRIAAQLRGEKYGIALVPHRSLRSALLARWAGIPRRVGSDRSQGRWLFTDVVAYNPDLHEIRRNLSLLDPLGISSLPPTRPNLFPQEESIRMVDRQLLEAFGAERPRLIAIAPGTAWQTKQWLPERFAETAGRLVREGFGVVLIGGNEDRRLCEDIERGASSSIHSFAGKLTLAGSAELLRRCMLLITNDSAPLHMADAVGTPVLAIFGATIPEFGFGPFYTPENVLQVQGLGCRPCSIHGGKRCPIGTFDCMAGITVEMVTDAALTILKGGGEPRPGGR